MLIQPKRSLTICAKRDNCQNQSGAAHTSILYEQAKEAWVHRVWGGIAGSQFFAQRCFERLHIFRSAWLDRAERLGAAWAQNRPDASRSEANSERRWKTVTSIGMRHTSRLLLVTRLTTAYVGLLGGRGLMVARDHGNSYSSRSPRPRKASGLRVVLCAERPNAANRAPQEQHRT